MRILLVASAGGHWIQLGRISPALAGHETMYASTMKGLVAPHGSWPVAHLSDASQSSPNRLPLLAIQLLLLLVRFRPHAVISTGAAPGLMAIMIGRLIGCRTIWLDSAANSEKLSWSGRMARRWADLWLTQWPELVEKYPGLRCSGSVL
jgi:hypothetical protein